MRFLFGYYFIIRLSGTDACNIYPPYIMYRNLRNTITEKAHRIYLDVILHLGQIGAIVHML